MRPGIVISDTIPTTSKTTTTSTTTTTMMSTSTTTTTSTTDKSKILNSKIKALEAELFGVLDASTNSDLGASIDGYQDASIDADMNASTDNEKETAATNLNTELEDSEVIQVQVKDFTVF